MRICPRGTRLGCTHQCAIWPCVTDREIELPWSMTSLLVSLFPSATLPWVNLPITEQASSLPTGNQTSVCLSKETIASLTLRVFSKPDSSRNTKSGVGAQPASAKCRPNQAGMTGSLKRPFLDLSEACTYVPGESATDGYAGHMVGRMPEPLKIGFSSHIPWTDAR